MDALMRMMRQMHHDPINSTIFHAEAKTIISSHEREEVRRVIPDQRWVGGVGDGGGHPESNAIEGST
jgi:hypothetical protein